MATEIRKKNATVIDRLLAEPHQFSFYQAVRLLIASGGATRLGGPTGEVGTIRNASDEAVRFRMMPALQFPPCEVVKVQADSRRTESSGDEDSTLGQSPVQMEVAFWGLIGPVGALPSHYTQLVIDRIREKDTNLRDFLGLFSHRQLSLFYRAWEKHFVASGFEKAIREEKEDRDALRESLLSIVGLGTNKLRGRLEILDDVRVFYGGQFVDRPNAESLTQILSDFLSVSIEVLSLFGDWLRLPKSEQSRLGLRMGHSQLGSDTVLGERTWDPAAKFRIRIGPVDYRNFLQLMPTGEMLVRAAQLVRSYVGCEYAFDFQVVLYAEEIPACRLTDDAGSESSARLGWNTWLCSRTPATDSDAAVFHHDGSPALY